MLLCGLTISFIDFLRQSTLHCYERRACSNLSMLLPSHPLRLHALTVPTNQLFTDLRMVPLASVRHPRAQASAAWRSNSSKRSEAATRTVTPGDSSKDGTETSCDVFRPTFAAKRCPTPKSFKKRYWYYQYLPIAQIYYIIYIYI